MTSFNREKRGIVGMSAGETEIMICWLADRKQI